MILDVAVETSVIRVEAKWVLAQEPPDTGIKITCPVEVKTRLLIVLASGVSEWIGECAGGRGQLAERVLRVRVSNRASVIGERGN